MAVQPRTVRYLGTYLPYGVGLLSSRSFGRVALAPDGRLPLTGPIYAAPDEHGDPLTKVRYLG